MLRPLFKRISSSAVAWSFASTILRSGASVFVLPLVFHLLPTSELAMWYIFVSLGSFGAILDAGMGPMTARAAGYLWGGAENLQAFGVAAASGEDRSPNYPLLRDLAFTLRRYYRFFAIAMFLVLLLAGGSWVYYKSGGLADASAIRFAYLVWCIGGLLNFTGDLWPYLLGGIGAVRESNRITFVSLIVYYVIAIGGLLCGLRLWALVLGNVVRGSMVRFVGRKVVLQRLSADGEHLSGAWRWDFLRALWPNGWRLALQYLGAYLTMQASTLVCSAFLDLPATASYGLTMQVVRLIGATSMTWMMVKTPFFNQWRTQGRHRDIAKLFARRLRLCLATYLAGALAFLFLGRPALGLIHAKTQLLPFAPLAFLLFTQLFEMNQFLHAELVLTENRNPFLRPYLISGAATAALGIVLTPRLGIWGLILSCAAVQSVFNYWWVVWRAVRGLEVPPVDYWRNFFGLRSSL